MKKKRSKKLKRRRLPVRRRLSLRAILSYKNPEIVAQFCRDLGFPKKQGQTLFEDVLRYLYLTVKANERHQLIANGARLQPLYIVILDEMLIIDEMWHTFVLNTEEYTKFSQKYFGKFMHHNPTPTWKSQRVEDLSAHERIAFKYELEAYMNFVVEELGEDVLERWFVSYPRKYSRKKIIEMKLKAVSRAEARQPKVSSMR